MLPIPEVFGFIIGILVVLITSLFCSRTQTESSSDQHQAHYRSRPNDQGTVENVVEINFVQIGNERVSRLDVEAGQGILLGAKISAAFTMPVVVLFAVLVTCGRIYSDEPLSKFVIIWSRILFYIRCFIFGSHSALINPIIFATYSPDLVFVWKQRFRR